MRHVVIGLAFMGVTAGMLGGFPGDRGPTPPLGTRIADFELPQALAGRKWSLADDGRRARAVVVVFLGAACPVSSMYLPTLADLQKTYAPKGVLLVGVFSNQQDSAAVVAQHAKDRELPFPVLTDTGAVLADRFHAQRVPEAFVLDGNRVVRYRGRIDDQFGKGIKRARPTSTDLRDALDAILANQAVAHPVTEVAGCPISRPPVAKKIKVPQGQRFTYAKHVAPILQHHCQDCHRPGEIGPFSLLTYKDALAWADAIREVVAERRMPPWFADPAHGKFANDRRLADADRATVLAWVDQGCIKGDPTDLPPPRKYVQGWGIGTPHQVITMNQEFKVPAQAPKNGIPYKYFLAGKPFATEKWVQAVEMRPGNRAAVHHATVFIVPPGKVKLLPGDVLPDEVGKKLFNDLSDGAADFETLAGFVPGDPAVPYPPGLARRIPKGSQLVFEIHYVANGKPGVDRTKLGLVYAAKPPLHEVRDGEILNAKFAIPPRAANHVVKASSPAFKKDIVLLSLNPHMHLRGKSFEYLLVLPNGQKEVLFSVPRYDFNWQLTYVLAEPKRLPKGSKIQCIAHFDNSKKNPNNPDPTQRVVWGDQTWEEMMIGYYEYYVAGKKR